MALGLASTIGYTDTRQSSSAVKCLLISTDSRLAQVFADDRAKVLASSGP